MRWFYSAQQLGKSVSQYRKGPKHVISFSARKDIFRSCSPFSVICFGKPPKTRTWNRSVMGRRGYLTQDEMLLNTHIFLPQAKRSQKLMSVLREVQVSQMEPTGDCGTLCYVCRSLKLDKKINKVD